MRSKGYKDFVIMEATTEKPGASIRPDSETTRRRSFGSLFRPHEPISRRAYIVAVAISLIILFGGWGLLSYGGMVKPAYFLPTPTQVFTAAAGMIQSGEIIEKGQASLTVVIVRLARSRFLAITPSNFLGSLKSFEAHVKPII